MTVANTFANLGICSVSPEMAAADATVGIGPAKRSDRPK